MVSKKKIQKEFLISLLKMKILDSLKQKPVSPFFLEKDQTHRDTLFSCSDNITT